ncbi:hypothetical protein HPB51_029757 [Rhipicephalus microplus]|uniref:Uncharacterized protein n=1 Tax=Rhipicephalus microplus TaxID=6941 RepID=A0A9J6CU44_RHIMP|nr:hypothetical protein HPB51_029757 [Rhipicephalus microplus]
MKEEHVSVVEQLAKEIAQLWQHMTKEKTSAIQEMKTNRKSLAEWSDISVEDILCERSELVKQLSRLSATVNKLQAEKKDLQEQLCKTNDELTSKKIKATSRPPRHTLQTNTSLLNVLSYLVKTYVNTEQEIQDVLGQLGLSRVDSPASNRAADVDYYGIGGMSCQAQGSKENFVGGFHSHLYEDGPDPTPRTCDKFASSIGMQDTSEMEREDVFLGQVAACAWLSTGCCE